MYDRRSDRRFHLNPTGMAGALAINGAVLAALFLAAPEWVPGIAPPGAIEARNIPIPPEPTPIEPEPQPSPDTLLTPPAPAPLPRPDMFDRIVDVPTPGPFPYPDLPPLPREPIGPGGTGTGATPAPEPPAPVMTGVMPDARYAGDFQPDYPSAERRDGREGKVVVRVLVGADGRVKAVERVSATSDAFFEATRRRAVSRWRFKPATRDGVAIESWHRMSVTFVMEN